MIGSRVATPSYWQQRLDESSKAREYEALKGAMDSRAPERDPERVRGVHQVAV